MIEIGMVAIMLMGAICGSVVTVLLIATAFAIKDNKRRNKNESVDR